MINTQAVQALIETLAEKLTEDAVIVDAIRAAGITPDENAVMYAARAAVVVLLDLRDFPQWRNQYEPDATAQPAAPECDLCKIRAGLKSAMDIIEPLPEIGSDHYDQPLANAFNALDEAYSLFKHNEHTAQAWRE